MKRYYVTAQVVEYIHVGTVTAESRNIAFAVAHEKYKHLVGTVPEDVRPEILCFLVEEADNSDGMDGVTT